MPSLSPPWSLHTIIESSSEPLRRHSQPRSSPFTHCHLPRPESETSSTTQASSPNPRCHFRAHNNVVLPEPVTLCTWRCSRARDAIDPCRPRACSTVVLPKPMMPLSPRCPISHNTVEPAPSLSPQRRRPPQARKAILYIFLCHFGPTNFDFDMLHCHVASICYIAFVLLHFFDVLHCHIALICYIAFNMSHCFDMLHCHIALICYIATLL
jgi:hypothetical protein